MVTIDGKVQVKKDSEVTDRCAEEIKEESSFPWGMGMDGSRHRSGAYGEPGVQHCAINIKHVRNGCRERSSRPRHV